MKAKIRNQFNQIPHMTEKTLWESNKNTRKRFTQESQKVSHFPAGNEQTKQHNKNKHETYMLIVSEGIVNMFNLLYV